MSLDLSSALAMHRALRPEDIALSDGECQLSHAELQQWVGGTRAAMAALGVMPGNRVALCADNCVELVVAMLACLEAGYTFIPLPYRDPAARLERLLRKARPALLLADRRKVLAWDGPRADLFAAVVPDHEGTRLAGDALAQGDAQDGGNVPAYVIFTSGSTGEPKGVCIARDAFHHAVHAAASIMRFDASTRSLLILPLHFDASFSSLFPVLASGGSVHVYKGALCLPADFIACFDARAITHTTITPSYMRALVSSDEWEHFRGGHWQTLATGGESPARDALLQIVERRPDIRIYNRYGPTECTMAVCTHLVTAAALASNDAIPIGQPHQGVDFYLLDAACQPVPAGDAGELYIGGAQSMQGYLDDPHATSAVLRVHAPPGKLLYRTGDMARVDAQGHYTYLGRADGVVKRNGLRISLAEIEQALMAMDDVTAAICIAVQDREQTFIVAYIMVPESLAPAVRHLRKGLLEHLPAGMLPDLIHALPVFPATGGGKADRQALRAQASHLLEQAGLFGERAPQP